MPMRRPDFESGEAGAESFRGPRKPLRFLGETVAAKLKKFSDGSGP